MITDKASNGPSASGSVHLNFLPTKAPHRPTSNVGGIIERRVANLSIRPLVPVISISLNDQLRLFKDEIGLEPAEHRLVHFKLQPTLLELAIQKAFDIGHFLGKCLQQPRPPLSLLNFWLAQGFLHGDSPLGRGIIANQGLAYLLSSLSRNRSPETRSPLELSLPHFLSCFRRDRMPKKSLAYFLSRFGRRAGTLFDHPMFNYNTGWAWLQGVGTEALVEVVR